MSIFIQVLAAGSLIFLCGLAVHLSYSMTRVFCFSHAVAISVAPYICMVATSHFYMSPWLAALAGVVGGTIFGFVYEISVARWMRYRGVNSWQQMLASLGYFILAQNTLVLIFGDQAQLWLERSYINVFPWFGGNVTVVQVLLCCAAVCVAILVWVLLYLTRVGIAIRGVVSTPELSEIIGVNVEQVRRTTVLSSCAVAALAGVLAAADVDMTPDAGFSLFLVGMVAAIIGGMGSIGSLVLAALFLAFCQQLAAWIGHSNWINSAVYFVLILVLIFKPLGFSGRRLKKIEI